MDHMTQVYQKLCAKKRIAYTAIVATPTLCGWSEHNQTDSNVLRANWINVQHLCLLGLGILEHKKRQLTWIVGHCRPSDIHGVEGDKRWLK